MSAGCIRCGGEKLPGKGQKLCTTCKEAGKQRDKERRAQRHRETYVPKTDRKPGVVRPHKPRAKKVYVPKPKPVKPPKVVVRKKVLSAQIRGMWHGADPNSIIKRKYPTLKALTEGMGT